MWCNRVGIRVFIFCLTLLFGFSTADLFGSNEIEQREIKRTIVSFNPKEIKHKLKEPQCKKYFDYGSYMSLTKELVKTKASFKINENSPEKMKKHRQKIVELERQLEILRKIKENLKILQREPNAVHNLLYIENCAEY